MSTAFAAPELSVADLLAGLKALFGRIIANPNLLPKIQVAWEAIKKAYEAITDVVLPPQSASDDPIVEAWLGELSLPPRSPEKIFDGKIIALISQVKTFLDTHPQLVALFLQMLAWLPKETPAPAPTV